MFAKTFQTSLSCESKPLPTETSLDMQDKYQILRNANVKAILLLKSILMHFCIRSKKYEIKSVGVNRNLIRFASAEMRELFTRDTPRCVVKGRNSHHEKALRTL